MTGAGACVAAAGAAPDLLRQLLRDCRGPDANPVRDFFQVPFSLLRFSHLIHVVKLFLFSEYFRSM